MAVPAVPGAGKTTVMLALLVELVKKNIKPQEILVLTYMESAARNFRERIQNANPDLILVALGSPKQEKFIFKYIYFTFSIMIFTNS